MINQNLRRCPSVFKPKHGCISSIKNNMLRRCSFLCHAILFAILITPATGRSEDPPKVLMLHSYYQVYHWTHDIMDGMMSVFESADDEINIFTEFLDAQRIPPKKSWTAFENYLKRKYQGEHFDVILASDDDVLDFLIPRYKEMFPGTPFVFCGINNLDESKFKQHESFIGISQEIDAKGTIELALKLLPRTENFLVISDRTSAGIKTTAKFNKDLKALGPLKQKFHLIDDFTLQELKSHLQALGPNDLVLVIRIQKIKGIDKRYPVKFLKFVTDTSPVPAFRVWGKGDSGFVGGVLVSAVAQGKAAAEIGLRILEGERAQEIPQVFRSPNVPILNYAVLKKFNISEKNIPQGVTITNRPIPAMEKYRRQIRTALISCVILALIIISLVAIIHQKRKSEKLILKSRKALHESEQKFRLIAETIEDVFWMSTPGVTKMIYVSPAYEKLWGKSSQQLYESPRSFIETIHPEDLEGYTAIIDTFHAKGKAYECEYRIIPETGSIAWIQERGYPSGDGTENTVLMTGLCTDISVRKQAEIALKTSERKYRELIELAQEGIWLIDKDGLTTFVNPSMARMLKYSPDEMIGKHLFNFMDQQGIESAKEKLQRRRQGISEQHDFVFLTKDGTRVFTTLVTTPVFDVDNHYSGALAGVIDATDRKMAEAEQEKLRNQLIQAQKLESIGNLAGGIAHDFNNILASMIGFTELALDETPKGTSLEDSLQEVYSAGKRAKELVKQILAFARQSDEKRSPVQPRIVAKEVLQFIRSTIPTTIEMRQDIQSDALIMANATQLHQVLMNLCTNAAQAMEKKGGILDVRMKDVVLDKNDLSTGMRPGDYVEIKVSDTGTGISPEIIESIFEPYFTTKGPGEGTGMGLAVVHGIMENYGGKVTVDSQLGIGTEFTIHLPVTKSGSHHAEYVPEQLPSGAERILFVDDEASIAKIGGKILERLGYSVATRTSSTEALELFRSKPDDFDLVVTDMTMPNMTGDKLSIELLKIRSDIPIILCTGYSKKISDELTAEIGIKAFVYKPMVKADLAKTTRKVLDEANSKTQQ